MPGRNVQNSSNKYWRVEEVFLKFGRETCRNGLSVQDVVANWQAIHSVELVGPNVRSNISSILHHYSDSNPNLGPKTPAIFRKIGGNSFNLIEFIKLDDAEEQSALALHARLFVEGAPVTAEHLRHERKSKAAKDFKDGLTDLSCRVCEFDFERYYGQLGAGFIEAHHVEPIALGVRITDTDRSFEAVCSNCHHMLHRYGLKSSDDLREAIRQAELSAKETSWKTQKPSSN